ncbi:MAG: type II toxin-antitoxin system ParD family antitoxin [Alphaproteobacteria bacterium]|nr:type II toxin-antitoxin system ParD family antitoxin [Alphaproteobacteria bacterium]
MPNVHLTDPMQEYVQGQIQSGAYANTSEVVRAGIRLLMEKEGARQFYSLKSDLEKAVLETEKGKYSEFDPKTFEPDAFTS